MIEWNELDAEGEEFKRERERGRDDVSRGREIGLYGGELWKERDSKKC